MKKIISFIALIFVLSWSISTSLTVFAQSSVFNTSWTNTFWDEFIPAEYRPWYPTNQSKVWLKSSWLTKQAIETNWSKSYLYNVLAFNTQWLESGYSLTPWYNAQSYLVFPKDLNGNFWDLSLQIRDLQFPDHLWNELRPIVNITYYDINNTPILDYHDTATNRYVIDDMWGWYQKLFDWDGVDSGLVVSNYSSDMIKPKNCNSDGTFTDKAWCKNSRASSSWVWSYNMIINLPLSKLSNRTDTNDYDGSKVWESIKWSKLKYVKIKISLASLVDRNRTPSRNPTQSSYFKCWALREDTLQWYIDKEVIWSVQKDVEDSFNNTPFSYGFTLESYKNTSPDSKGYNESILTKDWKTIQDLKDLNVLKTEDGLVFNNWTKYSINSLISYFWLFNRYLSSWNEVKMSDILKQNMRLVRAWDIDPTWRPTLSWQYGDRELLSTDPDRVTSRRQIQDQVSLRVTNINTDLKSVTKYPTVVMEWGSVTHTIRQPFPFTAASLVTMPYYSFLDSIEYTKNYKIVDWLYWKVIKATNETIKLSTMTSNFLNALNSLPNSTASDRAVKADLISFYIYLINTIITERDNALNTKIIAEQLKEPLTTKTKSTFTTTSDLSNFVIFYNSLYYEELNITEQKVKSSNWILTFLYRPLVIKTDFALEDCTKLYIKNQTTWTKREKYWRPEDNSDLAPWEDNDDWVTPGLIFRPYSVWQGFSYTPWWAEADFMTKLSSFEYLFWFKDISSPDYTVWGGEEQYIKEQGLPDLAGGAPSYNWKENAPVSNYYSTWAWIGGWDKETPAQTKLFDNLVNYCTAVTWWDTTEWSKCIYSHIPYPTSSYSSTWESKYNQDYYFSLYDVWLAYDTILNENPEYRSFLEKPEAEGWYDSMKPYFSLNPQFFTDSSKIFNWMYIPDWDWTLSKTLRTNIFLGAIPESIKKEVELWKPTGTEERVDQSFSWQTIYPFDDYLRWLSWVSETPWVSAFWYNLTIPAWERYLKLWSYDLDKEENGWNPPLDIEYLIRPVFEDKTLPKNDIDRNQFGPPVIKIGWVLDATWKLDSTIEKWQYNFYDQSTWKYTTPYITKWKVGNTSNIQDYTHNYSAFIKSWVNVSKVLELQGPEGNNSTSFQKIDLYKLKEQMSNAWCPDVTDTTNARCKDLAYFDNWLFDDSTKRLKTNITLRFVVKNPDWGSSVGRKPNILYLMSNGLTGPIPEPPLTNDNEDSNIVLMSSTKVVETSGLGKWDYYTMPEDTDGSKKNIIKFDGTDETLKSDILTFRIYQNEILDKWLVNPYLTLPLNENADIEKLSASEITELKKVTSTELEKWEGDYYTDPNYKDFSDLGDLSWTSTTLIGTDEVKFSKNNKTYKKVCIWSEDSSETYYTPDSLWTFKQSKIVWGTKLDLNITVPHQLVCFYRADWKTEGDLRANSDLRRLWSLSQESPFNWDILPFVDVSVKVKTNSTKNVTKYYNAKNIVKWTITDCLYSNYDTPYKWVDDITSSLSTIQSIQSSCFKEWGVDLEVLNRFKEKTYDVSYSIPETKRINLNFTKWADKLGDQDYKTVIDSKKLNTVAFSIRYPDKAPCVTNCEGLTAKWDYPKTKLENPPGNPIKKQDPDQPDEPTHKKNIWDTVTVYPKITNTSDKDICEVVVSTKTNQQISVIDSWDNQLITNNNIVFADSTHRYTSGSTIWWDGTIKNDLSSGRQVKYKYKIDWVNNNFWYLVKYKYCWEETWDYREQESVPISFAVNCSWPSCLGGGLCNLNATQPWNNSDVNRWSTINYNITCTNNTWNDIYDLQVKLPTPDKTVYKTWIKEEYIPLWSLPKWETISYLTNPLDLVKKWTVSENSYNNEEIDWILYSRYKNEEWALSYVEGVDMIKHIVKVTWDDKTVTTILRGWCNNRNEYTYTWVWQQYPYKPLSWMCVSKLPSTNSSWVTQVTDDNKACLVVRYYRLGKDTLISKSSYNNQHPDLEFWNGVKIDGTTNNLYADSRSRCRGWSATNSSCRSWNPIDWSDWVEWSVRSKYINVKVDTQIDIPSSFQVDWSWTTNVYTDYVATPSLESTSIVDAINDIRKYRVSFADWAITTENQVMNNDFQKVLKDWESSNISTLEKAFVELRIPLLAKNKWSDSTETTTNLDWETVWDSQTVKVLSSQIFFDRQRWLSKDSAVRCDLKTYTVTCSCGRWGCSYWTAYYWDRANGSTTSDTLLSSTNWLSFAATSQDSIPVCVSSDWKWFQVLNGGMFVEDLGNTKDIEHQVQVWNTASYNTNWFLNQDNNTLVPGWFMQHNSWTDNLFSLDQKYNTISCYAYNSQLNEYNYSSLVSVNSTTWKCPDWKYPWFYAIKNGSYWYNYKFNKDQLQWLLNGWVNLNKWSWTEPEIKDRVWVYSQVDNSNKDLVIWKVWVQKVEVEWMWSIFVTRDINNLWVKDLPYDKTHPENLRVTLNINSNVLYKTNTITTWWTTQDINWDSLAVVVNWNLKIWSQVEKLEWVYFVDGDVIIEESRNTLEIDQLFVTGKIIVKRKATTNSQVDRFTWTQDRPVLRITWGKKRYMYLQPKILQEPTKYYKEQEIEANDLNFDCKVHWSCN